MNDIYEQLRASLFEIMQDPNAQDALLFKVKNPQASIIREIAKAIYESDGKWEDRLECMYKAYEDDMEDK